VSQTRESRLTPRSNSCFLPHNQSSTRQSHRDSMSHLGCTHAGYNGLSKLSSMSRYSFLTRSGGSTNRPCFSLIHCFILHSKGKRIKDTNLGCYARRFLPCLLACCVRLRSYRFKRTSKLGVDFLSSRLDISFTRCSLDRLHARHTYESAFPDRGGEANRHREDCRKHDGY